MMRKMMRGLWNPAMTLMTQSLPLVLHHRHQPCHGLSCFFSCLIKSNKFKQAYTKHVLDAVNKRERLVLAANTVLPEAVHNLVKTEFLFTLKYSNKTA